MFAEKGSMDRTAYCRLSFVSHGRGDLQARSPKFQIGALYAFLIVVILEDREVPDGDVTAAKR